MKETLDFVPGAGLGSPLGAQGSCIWGGPQPPVTVNPLANPKWDSLVATLRGSSLFHTSAWASVLQDTYNHVPAYVCRFAADHLLELLPVMEVNSPWTGRRGVSLPFTDFCPALGGNGCDFRDLYCQAIEFGRSRGWRTFECRGGDYSGLAAAPSVRFHGHFIDLDQAEDALFKQLDSPTRRAVRKAINEGVAVHFSNSVDEMRTFYQLHCATRRRHGVPPQPWEFFENIARRVFWSGHGFVATARLQKRAVASAVFLHNSTEAIYKFGASDYVFQGARPNNLIMWEVIKWCVRAGLKRMHLGRTSVGNEGLRRFKLGLGAREETIDYYKYDLKKRRFVTDVDRAESWANALFRRAPLGLLRWAGRRLYPHLA